LAKSKHDFNLVSGIDLALEVVSGDQSEMRRSIDTADNDGMHFTNTPPLAGLCCILVARKETLSATLGDQFGDTMAAETTSVRLC